VIFSKKGTKGSKGAKGKDKTKNEKKEGKKKEKTRDVFWVSFSIAFYFSSVFFLFWERRKKKTKPTEDI